MKYIEALLISVLSVFAPIKASLITVLALTVIDMITGIWASKKRGELITSAGLRQSVSKIVIYEVAMCLGYLAQHYLLTDAVPALQIISGMVGMVELKSVLENLDSISGQDLLKSIITKLGSSNQ